MNNRKNEPLTLTQHLAIIMILIIGILPTVIHSTYIEKIVPTHPLGLLHATIMTWAH